MLRNSNEVVGFMFSLDLHMTMLKGIKNKNKNQEAAKKLVCMKL